MYWVGRLSYKMNMLQIWSIRWRTFISDPLAPITPKHVTMLQVDLPGIPDTSWPLPHRCTRPETLNIVVFFLAGLVSCSRIGWATIPRCYGVATRPISWIYQKPTLSTMLRTYVLSSMRFFQSHSSLSRADELNTSTGFSNYSRLSSQAKSWISCVVYKTDLHLWLLSILACCKPVSSRIQSKSSYSE